MAYLNAPTVARFLEDGYAVFTVTSPYDCVSAVTADEDGMVRSCLPVDGHKFGLALEVGGRAMNLLYPYPGGSGLCAHGLVKRPQLGSDQSATCGCGLDPIAPNPARKAA